MSKIRINVSAGVYQRVLDNQFSVLKVHRSVIVSVGDLAIIESDFKHKALSNLAPIVRQIIDIDCNDLMFEGSDFYDVFVRNNNYLS
jgi:hypothetical protein